MVVYLCDNRPVDDHVFRDAGAKGACSGMYIYINGTGNWSAAIWTIVGAGCGAYPGQTFAGDTVIIATGNTVTLDVSPANAIGALTVNTQAAGGTNGLYRRRKQSDCCQHFFNGSGTAGRFSTVSISTGTLNVTGNFTFAGTAAQARLTFTSTGTLNIGGNLGTAEHLPHQPVL